MRMQLNQQAAELLGHSAWVILTERVDDVALLSGQMVTMGLPEVLDRPIPRPWQQRGLRWGGTAGIWRAYILTEGDPRTVSVATDIKGRKHPLSHRSGRDIAPLDCSDDRLAHLLQHLSQPRYGHGIARDLHARSIAVYDVPPHGIRCDATTVSGAHEGTAGGLWQCGPSQDDPPRPHSKVRMGSLDPLGMPLSTDVLSGERADEGFDIPSIDRIRAGLSQRGLLCVGDGTMRALDTRAHMARHHDGSVAPWPLTGATAEAMDAWVAEGVAQGEAGELERSVRTQGQHQAGWAAEG